MKIITYRDCNIYFTHQDYSMLNELVEANNYSIVFILTDENTHEYCLPKIARHLTFDFEIIEIEPGEDFKTIDTCVGVWEALSDLGADRKSLIVNLGGGVITDLGGFVACTFKRGIDYVNIPTSLLSMVDASVGGKTGVDLGLLKNQIGVISNPEMVVVDTEFLSTLPKDQLRSGFAEMLKHGLIQDENYWNRLNQLENLQEEDLEQLIIESVEIKKRVVEQDPTENGLRKILNFGHTLGQAIGIGMILESFISSKVLEFPMDKTQKIKEAFLSIFEHIKLTDNSFSSIIELMKYDKKNEHGKINFVLLKDIGHPKIDCEVANTIIKEAFKFYNS